MPYRTAWPRPLKIQLLESAPIHSESIVAKFVLATVSPAETIRATKNATASDRSRSLSSSALRYCLTSRPNMIRIARRVPVNHDSATQISDTAAMRLVQSRLRAEKSVLSETTPCSPSRPGMKRLIWSTSDCSSSGRLRNQMPSAPKPTHSAAKTANSA